MKLLVLWQDIPIAFLSENSGEVKYHILFENLTPALKQNVIFYSILPTNLNQLPEWIKNRIPKNEKDKFEYLRKTQGRLETDDFWFKYIGA